jgi:hypothetical protein
MAPEGQPFGRYDNPATSARTPANGGDANLYPTLAISEAEARVGTSRVLTFPDGRQLPVSIPPGVQNGQMINLSDPGSATGILRLKLSVLTPQQAGNAGPLSWPGQTSTGNTATFVNNAGGTVLDPYWASSNNPMASRSDPVAIPGVSTFAMPGGASSGAGWAGPNDPPTFPPAQWQGGAPYPADTPPLHQASQRTQRSSSTAVLVSVIVVVFLILGSAGLLYAFSSRGSGGNPGPAGTSTSNQANGATGTAQANGSATAQAQGNGTTTAQADASATAQAQGTAATQTNATATAVASLNPYGGTLVLNDPLTDNSQGHQWREFADSVTGTSCQFTNGAYHMVMPGNYGGSCMGATTNFSNFAFQVQMTFSKEGQHFSGGGLVFRGDSSASRYYVLEIFESGQYTFYSCVSSTDCSHGIAGYPNASYVSSFHVGLNVTNTIAVVAKGDTFTFYANGQRFAGPITDGTYTQGTIGFYAEGGSEGGAGAVTDVAYSNAKVWQL